MARIYFSMDIIPIKPTKAAPLNVHQSHYSHRLCTPANTAVFLNTFFAHGVLLLFLV
jgi:hypothetical protein